jgi:hypothetical protein
MNKLRGTVVAVLLVGVSYAKADLTVVIDNPDPSQIINLTVAPETGSGVPSFSGKVYAGIYNETVNGVFTPSFCIDVAHDVSVGEIFNNYSYSTLADAPDTPAGPMGAATAINIEKLWAAYYTTAQSSGVTAAALQLAIWETEGGGQLLGNGAPGYTVTSSGPSSVTSLTATMLATLPSLTATADLEAIVSPTGQSYVIAVPETTTMIAGALLLLPLGISMLRILRRYRTSPKSEPRCPAIG